MCLQHIPRSYDYAIGIAFLAILYTYCACWALGWLPEPYDLIVALLWKLLALLQYAVRLLVSAVLGEYAPQALDMPVTPSPPEQAFSPPTSPLSPGFRRMTLQEFKQSRTPKVEIDFIGTATSCPVDKVAGIRRVVAWCNMRVAADEQRAAQRSKKVVRFAEEDFVNEISPLAVSPVAASSRALPAKAAWDPIEAQERLRRLQESLSHGECSVLPPQKRCWCPFVPCEHFPPGWRPEIMQPEPAPGPAPAFFIPAFATANPADPYLAPRAPAPLRPVTASQRTEAKASSATSSTTRARQSRPQAGESHSKISEILKNMANWLKRIDEQANEEVAKWGMAPDAALKDVWVSKLEDAMERVQLGFKTRELADIVQENSTKGESMYLDEAKLPKHQLPVLGFVGAKITGIVRKLRAGRDAVGQHQHRNMLSGLYEQARSVRSFGDRNYS